MLKLFLGQTLYAYSGMLVFGRAIYVSDVDKLAGTKRLPYLGTSHLNRQLAAAFDDHYVLTGVPEGEQ